jgi:hypothetical protein
MLVAVVVLPLIILERLERAAVALEAKAVVVVAQVLQEPQIEVVAVAVEQTP